MKIAVVGAQNVGKTTFVQDFAEEFSNYKSYTSSLKNIAEEKGLHLNQMTSKETQFLIMNHLYKLISEDKNENVIFDRCLIDNFVYTATSYKAGKVSAEFLEVSKEKMFGHLRFLDAIFFIPVSISISIEENKYRDTDKKYIDLVNQIFIEILLEISKISKIKIYVLNGDRKERIEQVKKYLF